MPVVIVLKVLLLWGKGQAYLLLTSRATIIMNSHLWASYWSMGDQKLGQEFCLPTSVRGGELGVTASQENLMSTTLSSDATQKLNTGVYILGHSVGESKH